MREREVGTDLFLRSGAIEGGDGSIEQRHINRLAQISELLGSHGGRKKNESG